MTRALIFIVACVFALSSASMRAEDYAPSTTEALAHSAVIKLSAAPTRDAAISSVAALTAVSGLNRAAEEYLPVSLRRAAAESQAEHNPARVRLLLTGPLERQVIDLFIYIDGQPFRTARERWIDERLAAAASGEKAPEKPNPPAAPEKGVDAAANQVQAPVRVTPTLGDRVSYFLAAVEQPVDRDEIVSLLEQWPAGHPLLLLGPGASWRRTNRAPLVRLLDADHDLALSATELSSAADQLKKADVNQDGVVTLEELERTAPAPSLTPVTRPLVVLLDPLDLSPEITLAGGTLSQDRLQALSSGPANISLQIDFRSDKESASQLQLMKLEAGEQAAPKVTSDESAITVDYAAEYVELSAVSSEGVTDGQPEQIAIGAAVDGYPLFRLLDADNNRQLTGREARRLPAILAELDRDRDGSVAASEIPTAVRLAVSRGPLVDRQLAEPTVAAKARAKPESTKAPAWFVSMDANRDGDLSRQEFSGTAEQFQSLDQDKDGLISADEAEQQNSK